MSVELARALDLPGAVLLGTGAVDVRDVTHDSRQAGPGTVFCCVRGAHHDGHDHAAEAVAAGAVALLTERRLDLDVPQVVVENVRAAMGPFAASVHGHPSRDLVVTGVTGTNGKTTTVHLLHAVFTAAGWPTEVIGTLTGARTTPEATDLQRQLARWRDQGVRAVAMEVSSHALALHRVDGTRFACAVFTNLGRDHLDFHGTLERYFAAKAELFTPRLTARAVVNVGDPHGRLLVDSALVPTTPYSLDDATEVVANVDGSSFTWRGHRVRTRLGGRFNVANAVAAATTGVALGLPEQVVIDGLADAPAVPGRFEVVDEGQPFRVVVDYAHTPDGLEGLLGAARELAGPRRVLVVFGCGGDRDQDKRPAMGAVAEAAADVVVLTSDNPRSEDPAAIIDAVRSGMRARRTARVEPDRRRAIASALATAQPGDVVVVAGKGHERTQVTGSDEAPFDDRAVVRELLRAGAGAP